MHILYKADIIQMCKDMSWKRVTIISTFIFLNVKNLQKSILNSYDFSVTAPHKEK